MPFPLIKLAFLFAKQASKPIANRLKVSARASPLLRKFADLYHYYDINIKRKILGQGKSNRTRFVNPDEAVEFGADILGEVALYSFLGVLLYTEYYILSRGSEKEKEKVKQHLSGLEKTVIEADLNLAKMEAEIRELQRTVGDLSSKCYSLEQKLDTRKKK